MPYKTLTIAAVLALLAACDRASDAPAERGAQPQTRSDTSSAAGASQGSAPTSPANLPAPSTQEKREGANPTQGQVDPQQREQHRDFEQRGDGAGPRGPDTTPRN